MPSVVQTQTMDRVSFMLGKERHGEQSASVFAPVNARQHPPSPPKVNVSVLNPTASDPVHVRPGPQPHPDPARDQKNSPLTEHWHTAPRQQGSTHYPASPPLDEGERASPKRKRATPEEDGRASGSPTSPPEHARPRMGSYAATTATMSPPQGGEPAMMDQHQRTLPPMNVIDHGRPWASRDSQGAPREAQYRDSQAPSSIPQPHTSGATKVEHSQHDMEVSSTTETTRAGVQVDVKKRKRQFANRTKTGCGTCRRRKKKCDEAKPYCNNCSRGGFICEGYPKRVQYVKNGVTRTPPALQAREQHQLDSPQLYHSHGAPRESYTENGAVDGARNRPIVVDEQESQQAPRNTWGNWNEQRRQSHAPEHSQPQQEYPHPPPATPNGRHSHPPSEHYTQQHAAQAPLPPPPQRHRIYHHTQQTMGQVVNNSPVVTAETQSHHPQQLQVHQPPPTGAPGPPPSHYTAPAPPRRDRSEKDKMLAGEAFSPYHHTLLTEREHCSKAVFRFNMTSNDHVQITSEEKHRHFQAVVAAKWIHRTDMDLHYRGAAPPLAGHVGKEVFVDAPFHCDYGYNLIVHDSVTIGPGCRFMDSGRISIGRNSRICANVTIDTQRVPMDSKSVKGSRGTVVAAEVSIGENVYIGANAVILAGVKIGTGAIIHPGSVVMKDIPRDCIARGNPANVSSVNWED